MAGAESTLLVQRLHAQAQIPVRMSSGAAGMDLVACLDAPLTVDVGARVRVPTGIALAIPSGFEGQVRPRSGLAWKKGLTVLNAPGTIDSDYRGEVMVLLVNLGNEPVTIEHGERVAQLVLAAVASLPSKEVEALSATDRGSGGFGSTGAA